jgi:hypothetical protein
MKVPLFGEFSLVVNENFDFWYDEAIEAEKFKCGDDKWGDPQYLLDVRAIGTSFVIPVVNFADEADCWWRQASNIQAIDSAGDASAASARNISAPSTRDILMPFLACVHTAIDAALTLQDLFLLSSDKFSTDKYGGNSMPIVKLDTRRELVSLEFHYGSNEAREWDGLSSPGFEFRGWCENNCLVFSVSSRAPIVRDISEVRLSFITIDQLQQVQF